MYHYDPKQALEELQEEALLPHPVKLRDMILRNKLDPEHARTLNNEFQEYLTEFGKVQKWAGPFCNNCRPVSASRRNPQPSQSKS